MTFELTSAPFSHRDTVYIGKTHSKPTSFLGGARSIYYTLLCFILMLYVTEGTTKLNSLTNDYCIYVDGNSPYYNPNKLTENQLIECQHRTETISEIHAIQIEIQKNRLPNSQQNTSQVDLNGAKTIPLFDLPTPPKANVNKKKESTPNKSKQATRVNAPAKPLYHADAGGSVDIQQHKQDRVMVTQKRSLPQDTSHSANQISQTAPNTLEKIANRSKAGLDSAPSAGAELAQGTDNTIEKTQSTSETLLLIQQINQQKSLSTTPKLSHQPENSTHFDKKSVELMETNKDNPDKLTSPFAAPSIEPLPTF